MPWTLSALTTLSVTVCIFLTVLSLNQIQVCNAGVSDFCNTTTPCDSNSTCQNSSCVCSNGTTEYNTICRNSSYGENCTSNGSIACEVGLTCHSLLSQCLCNNNTEFWFNGCLSVEKIEVTNISATIETKKISLSWTVDQQYSNNVTYDIITDSGIVESPVTSYGGNISGLTPATKYNFTVVSTPPKDAFINYRNRSVPTGFFWTNAVYGNLCQSENNEPKCVTGLTCRAVNANTALCVCNETQFWSNSCVESDLLKVTINSTIKRETKTITLQWKANDAYKEVKYFIKTESGYETPANSTGGSISGLKSGTKYNLTVVSVPPSGTYFTYKNVTVQTGDIWTNGIYGDYCNNDTPSCDTNLTCTNNKSNIPNCLCKSESEYYFNGSSCKNKDLLKVTITNGTIKRGTTTITLQWTVNEANKEGVKYFIKTESGYESPASITGGSISGLKSGTKYNLTVVSVPPDGTYFTYKNVTVQTGDIWTNGIYGDYCNNDTPSCDTNLTCTNNKSNIPNCLCNPDSEYYFNGSSCKDSSSLEVVIGTTKRENDSITLEWTLKIAFNKDVKYFIKTETNNESSANMAGGSISGLIPGTKHNLTVVSVPPQDSYITYRNVSVQTGELWTRPARPGKIISVISLNGNDSYNLTFVESIGIVNLYYLEVTGNGVNIKKSTMNSAIILNGLAPAKTYNYSLYAVNGFNDISEFYNDSFTTDASASGPVSKFVFTSVTNISVTINWQKPDHPNGNISGYLIEVFNNTTCHHVYKLNCSDCVLKDTNMTPSPDCLESKINRTFVELENSLVITELKSYQNYTVCIAAYNEAGQGKKLCLTIRTSPGTPNRILNVSTINIPYDTNANTVGLNVTWIPGEYTGPTNYTVCLIGNSEPNCTTIFEETFYEFQNVLAYWDYHVTVQASTEAGVSERIQSTQVKTLSKMPGYAYLMIELDKVIAGKLFVNVKCPDEKSRNGIIKSYNIYILNLNSSEQMSRMIMENDSCTTNKSLDLSLKAEQSYNIAVQVQNNEYIGYISQAITVFTSPNKPILSNGLKILQKFSEQTTTVALTLCADCILNDTQGKVVKAGLIVCLPKTQCFSSPSRRKRALTEADINIYYDTSYSDSKAVDFTSPYRTTPSNWSDTLQNSPSYIIGNESSCVNVKGTFCNAPIGSDTKFRILIIVCTKGGCSDSYLGELKTQAETDNTSAIVGGVVGGILGLALIIAVVFLIIYFKRRPKYARPSSSTYMESLKRDENIKEHRPIRITDFKDHVKKLHKDSNLLFQDEFEDIKKLSSRLPNICDEAKKENNRVKNRYVDILPYDSSRVKLEVQPEDDETMDFINANYIPGYNSVREYIATQGPMHSTVPDFWRMVWEQKCRVIVMLSDLTEQGKPKVTLYWPENLGEPINYGNVIVEMTNFSQLNKYIIRNFKIAKGSETRKVTHFFLPGWWDFSANLTTGDVLEFAQLVRQEATPANSGPIVVHCSAGVGRTGTFIALDYFMQYIEKHSLLDSVDVFSYVMKMRAARPRMVQAETQYIFIFDALDEVIDRKIKIEQEKNEHLYSNGGGNDVYANMVKAPEESIYANTQVINEKNGIDNKAFESDYENLTLNKTNQPTTVL